MNKDQQLKELRQRLQQAHEERGRAILRGATEQELRRYDRNIAEIRRMIAILQESK